MSEHDPLSRAEFLAHMGYVRQDLAEVKDHLAQLNGRTREVETKIAILEVAEPQASKAAAWGGGVGGVIVGVAEAARWIFGK